MAYEVGLCEFRYRGEIGTTLAMTPYKQLQRTVMDKVPTHVWSARRR
jgi:hypothetical protein